MEPMDPAPNPPEDPVAPIVLVLIVPEDPAVHRSTRVPRPSTKYPTAEYDFT